MASLLCFSPLVALRNIFTLRDLWLYELVYHRTWTTCLDTLQLHNSVQRPSPTLHALLFLLNDTQCLLHLLRVVTHLRTGFYNLVSIVNKYLGLSWIASGEPIVIWGIDSLSFLSWLPASSSTFHSKAYYRDLAILLLKIAACSKLATCFARCQYWGWRNFLHDSLYSRRWRKSQCLKVALGKVQRWARRCSGFAPFSGLIAEPFSFHFWGSSHASCPVANSWIRVSHGARRCRTMHS